ncbi:MAG: DNA translocase FtsK 4TM domain-containing protein [Deltaproteobacteria bacterium]|nr:DNA translocase FtsK 4TM domain-containing protein [Deltaproteobacteria bacterium]
MASTATKRRSVSRKKTSSVAASKDRKLSSSMEWANEALAVIFFAFSIFILISFLAHQFGQDDFQGGSGWRIFRNPFGPVGHFVGTVLSGFMGWCALAPVAWAMVLANYFWNDQDLLDDIGKAPKILLLLGFVGILIFSCALTAVFWGATGGGSIGNFIAKPLVRFFSEAGAILITGALFLLSFAIATRQSVASLFESAKSFAYTTFYFFGIGLPRFLWWSLRSGARLFLHSLEQLHATKKISKPESSADDSEFNNFKLPKPRIRKNVVPLEEKVEALKEDEDEEDESEDEAPAHAAEVVSEDEDSEEATEQESGGDISRVVVKRRDAEERAKAAMAARKKRKEEEEREMSAPKLFPDYELPDVALLSPAEPSVGGEDDNELREKSRQIENKLKDFGIYGKVTHVHPGPVITLFEFEPAAGVKVGKIAALQDDLAMGLRASSIRIIAPIPKRGTVGIEVPNKHRDIVRLRDVLESEAFLSAESILSVPVGKDTYGDPVVADIATMPHLLMAGATGTGKSVCINALLVSLLYRARPEELGLILIDPKILELSVYEDIPHLRVPVVTDPRQAKGVLTWAANEMNRRYRMMQRFGVRNIDGYNALVRGEEVKDTKPIVEDVIQLEEESVVQSGTIAPADLDPQTAVSVDAEGEVEVQEPIAPEKLEPLPKIVIVIDELADLMLTVGRDIEELITRLAQKARAAGIHLIIATQRPSVDVITGLIKANFPARLSFRVTARVDSRTILDQMGADKLLGRGDMLFMLPGADGLRRVHGAFVSDTEVKRVVDSIKKRCKPQYDERIMEICQKAIEEDENGETKDLLNDEGEYDAIYDKAVELVLQKGQASTSMLQRAFRIGYNRAARIVDMMEKEGLVGPMDGAKPREVIVPTHDTES